MLRLQTNPQMPHSDLAPQPQFCHYNYAAGAPYTFTDDSAIAHSLAPQNLSPVDFGTNVHYYSSSSSPSNSSPTSSCDLQSNLPSTPPKKPATRLRSGNRVPRPRNAFMIFRSEFAAKTKISKSVEHDHRHISRIVGHCWNNLNDDQKQIYRDKARDEKREHSIKYPDYRFTPNVRTKQVIRRKVKRNGEDEMQRCKDVANLILLGKQGEELDHAIKSIDRSLGRQSPTSESKKALGLLSNQTEFPIFDSPLVPPSLVPKNNVQDHHYSAEIQQPCSQGYNYQPTVAYGQDWNVQYSAMSDAGQQTASYQIQQHYASEPQQTVVPSSSQGYNTAYHSTPQNHQESMPVVPSQIEGYSRSSAFHVEFTGPFDYHESEHTQQSHDPNLWIPSHHGH
ncbi:hypothetical protein H0H87_010221 [Tephrocybe sp. NHM501043]|nr:hypothetical protein H0H87_010221 [Tephrocybe sp. NHM501043]